MEGPSGKGGGRLESGLVLSPLSYLLKSEGGHTYGLCSMIAICPQIQPSNFDSPLSLHEARFEVKLNNSGI
jgi:hypothetical protein